MKLNKNNTYTITHNGNKVEVPVKTAKQMHRENELGNGASTIGIEFGFTTNQADGLIDAYRRDFVNTETETETEAAD